MQASGRLMKPERDFLPAGSKPTAIPLRRAGRPAIGPSIVYPSASACRKLPSTNHLAKAALAASARL
jgi:hypothetical protein